MPSESAAMPTAVGRILRGLAADAARQFVRLGGDERGQTMAEYAILRSVIAAVVVSVAITLGGSSSSLISSAATSI